MKLHEKVTLVFKNKEGLKLKLRVTINDILEKTLDDFYEELEPECTSSGCYNENQNFCDCGCLYEDYELHEVLL